MKNPYISSLVACLSLLLLVGCQPPAPNPEAKPELGLQTWTLRKLTLAESIDKAAELGISSIEAYPGQKLGGGIEGVMNPNLEPEKLVALKKILADHKVTISGFGVITQASED